jgi:tetratricopeptide (TPR) repeat protein
VVDPRNGKVLWQLADLFLRAGQPAKAEAVARDAIARRVDEHRFLLKLGESQIEARRYDEAEKSLLAALEKKSDLDTARFNLGLVYEERGESDKAVAAYRGELEVNPKAYRAAFNLAKLLQKAGRREEAVAYFRRLPTCSPSSVPANSTSPRPSSTRAISSAPCDGHGRASRETRSPVSPPWATTCSPTCTTAGARPRKPPAKSRRRGDSPKEAERPGSGAS